MTTGLEIHRLLDEAFAGVEMTAEVQDLKEEMRGNLGVRVSELERQGAPGDQAARRAIAAPTRRAAPVISMAFPARGCIASLGAGGPA